MTYKNHLTDAEKLITDSESIVSGFIAQALRKSQSAIPVVNDAHQLMERLQQVNHPNELVQMEDIHPQLLTAMGMSRKALNYMQDTHKLSAIEELNEKYLEPAGHAFREEIVFRYLITEGETLGGSLRNWIGAEGKARFAKAIVMTLAKKDMSYSWLQKRDSGATQWVGSPIEDFATVRGIAWYSKPNAPRTMVFDRKVHLIKKNVDVCLLRISAEHFTSDSMKIPDYYVALGEIKGGIDPAGADEHWKTARSALSRIRANFAAEQLAPKIFFVGAAIVPSQASEIWNQLENGTLQNVANLTVEKQLMSLCLWLLSL